MDEKEIHLEDTGDISYSVSTIPSDYIFWFKQCPQKTISISGESKSQIIHLFQTSVLQSNLGNACLYGVELHCSGQLQQVINVLITIIGTHVHIHNPDIASRFVERYKKYYNQINVLPKSGLFEIQSSTDLYRPEVLEYDSNLNSQEVRNFVVEVITIVTLSHQKEISLPKVNKEDVNQNYLYKVAKNLQIGGSNILKMIEKNELQVVLKIIEKYLLYKVPKSEEVIFWILWLCKMENKIKRKGENLPCKKLNIDNVQKNQTDHWVWYIWKSLFSRLSFYSVLKKKQIVSLYEMFKIDFTKSIVIQRLPILFFAVRLLKNETSFQFPPMMHNIHLYVQAYSNINTLYRNLQNKLMTKSWTRVVDQDKIEKASQPTKQTKKMMKEMEQRKEFLSFNKKMEYLSVIPKANNHF